MLISAPTPNSRTDRPVTHARVRGGPCTGKTYLTAATCALARISAAEDIPWRCRPLVIGTGADGALPVLRQVRGQARRRKIDLVVLPTAEAIGVLAQTSKDANAILHLTW